MRFLFICGVVGGASAALHRRWRMRVPWEGTPHSMLILILALAAFAVLAADFLLNTRPVPGEEHTGLLEWALRLLGLGLAGTAAYLAYR
jgi:uncharacterized membrane protein